MTETNNPIFIGGLSYSGKTQLRLLLAKYTRLNLTRRTFLWKDYYQKFGDLGDQLNFTRCLDAILEDKHIREFQPEPARLRQAFARGPATYSRLFGLLHDQYAEKMHKNRWGIQSGMVEIYADQLFNEFSSVKIIHLVRDPRKRIAESLASVRGRPWKPGWEAANWQASTRLALHNRRMHPEGYQIFSWELLRDHPKETLQAVCTFIEEDFTKGSIPEKYSDSHYELSKIDAAFVQSVLVEEMNAVHYTPFTYNFSLLEKIKHGAYRTPLNLAGVLLWRVLGSRRRQNFSKSSQNNGTALRWAG